MRSDRGSRRLLAPLLMGATLALSASADAGAIVERTLAFVNKKPVLLSDVALTRALLQVDDKDALERTIEEVMMYEDASRLLSEPARPADLEVAVLALKERAGPGFKTPALTRKALVQLAIKNYIDIRLRPLVRVDDAEVRKVFNERLAGLARPEALSAVAPEIRDQLERRALDQRIEEWVTSLRRREEVRFPQKPR
jgi:predicted ribosome quality control (RQC) complex YloA/Tae2 family protein